ncbi:hypothetical protein XFF6992_230172 [Xanthomonas citri pv. fuscans]|nr:hypothetical protein XFF6992_230172 [Xanthomonas citri pv. fuscans]
MTVALIGRDWAVAVRDHHVFIRAKDVPTPAACRLTSAQADSSGGAALCGDQGGQRVTKFVTLSGLFVQVVRSVRSTYAVHDDAQAFDARSSAIPNAAM